jgi:hypothetical protein
LLEPLAYHSGCLVNKHFYIIGGQNIQLKQTNNVYIYDIEENKLSRLNPQVNNIFLEFPNLEFFLFLIFLHILLILPNLYNKLKILL